LNRFVEATRLFPTDHRTVSPFAPLISWSVFDSSGPPISDAISITLTILYLSLALCLKLHPKMVYVVIAH
jgi:hypothetical protein